MIHEMYGQQTTAVSVDLGVAKLSEEKAAALGVVAGDPSLRVVRRYVGARGEAFQISVSEHPADRYNFRLQWQYGLSAGHAWPTG
jgi:GntR family transcriptional regulator